MGYTLIDRNDKSNLFVPTIVVVVSGDVEGLGGRGGLCVQVDKVDMSAHS